MLLLNGIIFGCVFALAKALATVDYKKCSVRQLDLASLAGDWQLAYYMDPLKGTSVKLNLRSKGADSLTGSLVVNGRRNVVNLNRPDSNQAGVLLNSLPSKRHGTVRVPVVIIAAEPTQFMATWQAGPSVMDWAIYKRPSVKLLDKRQIEKATGGLKCLQMSDKHGGIMIYSVE